MTDVNSSGFDRIKVNRFMSSNNAEYSLKILSCSSPVNRLSFKSSMAFACSVDKRYPLLSMPNFSMFIRCLGTVETFPAFLSISFTLPIFHSLDISAFCASAGVLDFLMMAIISSMLVKAIVWPSSI